MFSDSDSEEFYDAEDITPSHGTRYKGLNYLKIWCYNVYLTPNKIFGDIYRILKDFSTRLVIYLTVNKKQILDMLTFNCNQTIFGFCWLRSSGKSSKESITKKSSSEPNISGIAEEKKDSSINHKPDDAKIFIKPQLVQVGSRKRFKEIREKLQIDDEECHTGTVTPPNSQTSSVEGIPAPSRTIQPFRIIEPDTLSLQSINSLGRIGRILGGVSDTGKMHVLYNTLNISW